MQEWKAKKPRLCSLDEKRSQGMFEVWQKHVCKFLKAETMCEACRHGRQNKERRKDKRGMVSNIRLY